MIWLMQPLYLWWLAAAAVPLALFFLRRRRLTVVDFPPAQLLAEAALVRTRLVKLLELLLLAVRVLLVVVAALVMVDVVIEPSGLLARFLRTGEVEVIAFVDDTHSMLRRHAPGEGALYHAARRRANGLVEAGLAGSVVRLSGAPADGAAEGNAAIPLKALTTKNEPDLVAVLFTDGALDAASLFPVPQRLRRAILVPVRARVVAPDAGIESVWTDEPFPIRGAPVGLIARLKSSGELTARLSLREKLDADAFEEKAARDIRLTRGETETSLAVPAAASSPSIYLLSVESPDDGYAFNDSILLALDRFPPLRISVVAPAEDFQDIRMVLAPTGRPALDGTHLEPLPYDMLSAGRPEGGVGESAGPEPGATGAFIIVAGEQAVTVAEGWWAGAASAGGRVLFWGGRLPSGFGRVAPDRVQGLVTDAHGRPLGAARTCAASRMPPRARTILSVRSQGANLPCAFALASGRGEVGWCGLDATSLPHLPWGSLAAGKVLDAMAAEPAGLLIVQEDGVLSLPAKPEGSVLEQAGRALLTVRGGTLHAAGIDPGIYELVGVPGRLNRRSVAVIPASSERFPPDDCLKAVDGLAGSLRAGLDVPVTVVADDDELAKAVASAAGMSSLGGPLIALFLLLFLLEALLANHLAGKRTSVDAPGAGRIAV